MINLKENIIISDQSKDNLFRKPDPLQPVNPLFTVRSYVKGTFNGGAGPIYFIGAENRDERNELAGIAQREKHGFGYPNFTKATALSGAFSDAKKEVVDNVAGQLKNVRQIGNISPATV